MIGIAGDINILAYDIERTRTVKSRISIIKNCACMSRCGRIADIDHFHAHISNTDHISILAGDLYEARTRKSGSRIIGNGADMDRNSRITDIKNFHTTVIPTHGISIFAGNIHTINAIKLGIYIVRVLKRTDMGGIGRIANVENLDTIVVVAGNKQIFS